MFMSNHLNGFGASPSTALVTTIIPGATGTTIGNMTGLGGLAASFDDNNSQAYTASTYSPGGAAGGYVGKQWGASKTITACDIYSPTDRNFTVGTGSDSATILLRGSNDGSSWTTLATIGPTAFSPNTGKVSFTGINVSSAYSYHSVADNGGGTFAIVAEVDFWEDV
jgi:hypothetical protein